MREVKGFWGNTYRYETTEDIDKHLAALWEEYEVSTQLELEIDMLLDLRLELSRGLSD